MQRPLKQGENKRNDTSYNFINGKQRNENVDKSGKRILSQNCSPNRDIQDENRPPSTCNTRRYEAR